MLQVSNETHSRLSGLAKTLQKRTLHPSVHCGSDPSAATDGKQPSVAEGALDRLAASSLEKAGIAGGADRGSGGGVTADMFKRLRDEVTAVAPSASQLLVGSGYFYSTFTNHQSSYTSPVI